MSETTFYKQENGLYTMEYITGEWFTYYDVTPEDKKKGRSYIIKNYEEHKN